MSAMIFPPLSVEDLVLSKRGIDITEISIVVNIRNDIVNIFLLPHFAHGDIFTEELLRTYFLEL
jgi:hypothetical protein